MKLLWYARRYVCWCVRSKNLYRFFSMYSGQCYNKNRGCMAVEAWQYLSLVIFLGIEIVRLSENSCVLGITGHFIQCVCVYQAVYIICGTIYLHGALVGLVHSRISRNFTRSFYVRCKEKWGGGHNLKRPNVKRPIFRNYEISNIKKTKIELFGLFIFNSFLF